LTCPGHCAGERGQEDEIWTRTPPPDLPALKITVPLSGEAANHVRDALETQYAGKMDHSLLDDVKIGASELAANAVRHSGRPEGDPITLTSSVSEGVLRIEVIDQGPGLTPLVARQTPPTSGLHFVEVLSDRWSSKHENSFHVWFEIDLTPGAPITRAKRETQES
jgi:anti-sigma regulatory factor (Ser/Thr protein kinase)